MSFGSGLAHLAGNVVAADAKIIGGITGNNNIKQLGANISNPYVTLTNPSGVLSSNNPAFTGPGAYGADFNINTQGAPVSASDLASINAAKANVRTVQDYANTDPNATSYGSTGYGSSSYGSASPELVNSINGQFDRQIQSYRDQQGLLDRYNNLATDDISNSYNTQNNTLQTQHAQGLRNLDLSQQQLDQGKARSFRDLTNQMRGLVNGYANQLGTYGAGNSSANQVINYALAQQGNRSLGDLDQQVANQQTGLNANRDDLETNFKNSTDGLINWRDSQMHQIANNYANTMQQLSAGISNAQGYKAQTLAQYGQVQAAQQALAQLQALDQEYNKQIEGLRGSYQPMDAGKFDIAKFTGGYNVQPISPASLNGINLNNIQAQQEQTVSPVSLKRNEQLY